MNQKSVGIILIVFSLLLAGLLIMVRQKEDMYIDMTIEELGGTCYLDDGSCLHEDRDYTIYIIGGALSAALFLFGAYLSFVDRTQQVLAEHQIKVAQALENTKKHEMQKDEFRAFLSGFSKDEQKILSVIHEQEGIKQSTLRYKTDLSKTSLSLMLKSLEERKIISKKPYKKTNKLFLQKRF